MDSSLTSLQCLEKREKNMLLMAGLSTLTDLLISRPASIANKLRQPIQLVEELLLKVSREVSTPPQRISEIEALHNECFTTGDDYLDSLIAGGIRTGAIWEFAGEGAAGKTQLALQLALSVQLPIKLGGLFGSVCYLTSVGASLPTTRLQQLIDQNPLFSKNNCSLSNIQTHHIAISRALTYVLGVTLPTLLAEASGASPPRPVKLVIIDSLASILRTSEKTSSNSLQERSKFINETSSLMHQLSIQHSIAFVVINEVTDVFGRDPSFTPAPDAVVGQEDLIYKEQARWFNRPSDLYWSDNKEAALGLVWANHVNVRLFLSRTSRREVLESPYHQPFDASERGMKRRKLEQDGDHVEYEPTLSLDGLQPSVPPETLIRRIDVVFSSFASPSSTNFILTPRGFSTLPEDALEKQRKGRVSLGPTVELDLAFNEQLLPPGETEDMIKDVPPSSTLELGIVHDDDEWGLYYPGGDDTFDDLPDI